MPTRTLLAAMAASLVLATPAAAALRFQPVATVTNTGPPSPSSTPASMATADLDLVTANPGSNDIAVFINRTRPGSAQYESVRSSLKPLRRQRGERPRGR